MSLLIWFGSFFYLVLVAGWITATVREGHPAHEGDQGVLRRTLSIAAMIAVVTVAFGLLIWGIESLT